MLKWLENVFAAKPLPEQASAPSPAKSRTAAPPKERPLPAPSINLDIATSDEAFAHGILSRQVIVDRAYHPIGYEFGLRAESTHHGAPTARILAGVLNRLGKADLSAGRQSWLRLTDTELAESPTSTIELAHSIVIIELTAADPAIRSTALEHAHGIKANGIQLALADWSDTEQHHTWLPLCDFVEVRNSTHNLVDFGGWPEQLALLRPGVRVVACGVDSWEELEFCHRQKFDLFRGHFLTHRENWPRQPKISPERGRLIDLLNRLHLGTELTEIADQLKQSPELSYRLLRYINSAGIGTAASIASIQQGLMILGRDKTYRWLTVLLFTSGQGKSLDTALLEQALVRARLMELVAGDQFNRLQTDELFVVGIFSMLDMLLQLPMSVALEPLKLPSAVADALLHPESAASAYAPFLNLAIACEDSDSDRLKQLSERLAIPLAIVNSLHLDALVWTQLTLTEK